MVQRHSLITLWLAGLLFFIFWGNIAVASLDGEFYLAQGTKLYLEGSYREAKFLFKNAAAAEPSRELAFLLLGLTHLALEEYGEARESFLKARSLAPDDPEAKMYLGITEFFLEDYREAARLIADVCQKTGCPDIASYYLGLCYWHLNEAGRALPYFRQAARSVKGLDQLIKPREAMIPEDNRPQLWRFENHFGFQHDTNVPVRSAEELIGGKPARTRIHRYSRDWGYNFITRLEYYPVLRPDWNLGTRFRGYYDQYANLEITNFCNLNAQTFVTANVGPFLVKPTYFVDYTLHSAERYSFFHGPSLVIDWPQGNYLVGEVSYRFMTKKFFDLAAITTYDRDGGEHQAGFFQGLFLPPYAILRLGVAYERTLSRRYMTSKAVRGIANGVLLLPWGLEAFIGFEYALIDYDNRYENLVYNRLRRDTFYQVTVQFKKQLTENLALWAGWGKRMNFSTIPDYEYDPERDLFKFALIWRIH